MPNWCSCDLFVTGKDSEIQKFIEGVKSSSDVLDANKIIPYPKKYRDLDEAVSNLPYGDVNRPKDGFNSGGYEWCCKNWGTKWGFCDSEIVDRGSGSVQYYFNTAWSPPVPLIVKLSGMYDLEFDLRYYECGMAFCGQLKCKSGKILVDHSEGYTGERGG